MPKVVGKLSEQETWDIIQSFGRANIDVDFRHAIHNPMMKKIAERFNVKLENIEIDPQGQVLDNCCDAEIDPKDVSVEE